jgi:uncharacterized protein
MYIDVSDLRDEGIELEENIDLDSRIADYDEIQSISQCRIFGEIKPIGKRIFRFRGVLHLQVEAVCARCLSPFPLRAERSFQLRFFPSTANDRYWEAEGGVDPEMLDVSYYREEKIDLDQVAEEQMNLSFPMRMLCREDCKGVCPFCGADLNQIECGCKRNDIDPRLEDLKKLL